MISLRVQGESDPEPKVESFAKDELSIGRVAGNDLVLANTTVSSHHARIYRSNGSWTVADQQSTNGTFLNGQLLAEPASLSNGDEIAVGDFRIHVDLGEGGGRKEAVAPPAPPAEEARPPASSGTIARFARFARRSTSG